MGLFLPALEERCLSGLTSQVTSDGLVDGLRRWWEVVSERCASLTTLVMHLAHGPEHHSRRTPGMQRLVDFAHHAGLTVRLASSPPSHRKDNPLERCWGIRANHWHGALLDSMDTVSQFATTLTGKGKYPGVELGTTT